MVYPVPPCKQRLAGCRTPVISNKDYDKKNTPSQQEMYLTIANNDAAIKRKQMAVDEQARSVN
jgi:hypothetical protein